jgi:hypothetical protein
LAEINRWTYGEEHGTLTYRLRMAYTHSRSRSITRQRQRPPNLVP